MNITRPLASSKFLLLGVTASFVSIHLSTVWRSVGADFLAMSLLFWQSALSLIWTKRDCLNLKAEFLGCLVGASLVTLLLYLSNTAITGGNFLRIYPFLAGVGIALLASGFQGLWQYWKSLILLFFLGVPEVLSSYLIDISPATAQLSTTMLWYTGFNVARQGVNIHLYTSNVEVYPGCSGLQSMMQMLGLSVLILLILPLRWTWKHTIGIPLMGMMLAFIVNAVRVALMVILFTRGQKLAFAYWHLGTGSLIFSGIEVFLFILLLQWFLPSKDKT